MTTDNRADPGPLREVFLVICDNRVYDWRATQTDANAIVARLAREGRQAHVVRRDVPAGNGGGL